MVRVWVAPGAIVKYEVKSIPSWGAGKLQVENLARISPYTGSYYTCKDIFIATVVEGYYPQQSSPRLPHQPIKMRVVPANYVRVYSGRPTGGTAFF